MVRKECWAHSIALTQISLNENGKEAIIEIENITEGNQAYYLIGNSA